MHTTSRDRVLRDRAREHPVYLRRLYLQCRQGLTSNESVSGLARYSPQQRDIIYYSYFRSFVGFAIELQ